MRDQGREKAFVYRVWLAIIVIIAALVFAWWASGEVYNHRPTDIPTVGIPTRVTTEWITATATVVPTTTLAPTVTQTVLPTATSTPQPTFTVTTIPTAAETDHSATLTPTARPKVVYEQPDIECEMIVYKHNHAIYYPYCWEWLK